MKTATKTPDRIRRQVVVRFVPAPAGWTLLPALDILSRSAGYKDFADLSEQARARSGIVRKEDRHVWLAD